MSKTFIPQGYKSLLSVKETEHAIVMIKDFFQLALSTELNLTRVTAPLFVECNTGLNDDLNGVERAVTFPVKDMNDTKMEIVHSLAKWKRVKIADMELPADFGIYTDMNAIRADEELDNIHSLYVDQWDWEKVITDLDRTSSYLKDVVKKIYRCLKRTEFYIYDRYPQITPILPEEITFIYADDLQRRFPNNTPKERENIAAKHYGAVFIMGIGAKMSDGTVHDGRAPDYDDYSTLASDSDLPGLNGDLLVWNDVLDRAVELSSMGIRVDKEALLRQLKESGKEERLELYFHRRLVEGSLPLCIGGGIGQSRLCMLYLRKAHIGEIQASIWPDDMRKECELLNIPLI